MFTPENELERSLMKASADPAHRPRFYQDFIASDVYAITPSDTPSEVTNFGKYGLDDGAGRQK